MAKAKMFSQYAPLYSPIFSNKEVEKIPDNKVNPLLSINYETNTIDALFLEIVNKCKDTENKEQLYPYAKNALQTLLKRRLELEGIEAKDKIEQIVSLILSEYATEIEDLENFKRQIIKYLK